ncbi:hypothetical protein ACD578_28485 (plasmid) [Microvirga sp. RSM25]
MPYHSMDARVPGRTLACFIFDAIGAFLRFLKNVEADRFGA